MRRDRQRGACPSPVGVVDDVRTFNTKCDKLLRVMHKVRLLMNNEVGAQILRNIKTLRERFEPETIVKKVQKRRPTYPRAEAALRRYRDPGDDVSFLGLPLS